MRRTRFGQEKQSFSIRKYSLGAASVLIGTSLVFGLQDVKADEQVGTAASSNLPLVQVGENNQSDQLKSEPAQLVDETQKVASQTEGQASVVESSHTLTSESQVSPVASSQEKPNTTTSQESSPQETSVVEATPSAPIATATPATPLPAQGQYIYEKETAVRNQPSQSAQVAFYAQAGDKVNYDKTLQSDGHQWLSYVSYSGVRRYVDLGQVSSSTATVPSQRPTITIPVSSQSPSAPQVATLASRGSYTFTKEVAVKNEAKESATTQFTFEKGDKVNYDKTLQSDGHQWLSYVSYSGTRRYVDLGQVSSSTATVPSQRPTITTPVSNQSPSAPQVATLASRGSYTFTKGVAVKNEAKESAATQFTFEKGDKVNYDKTLQSDGHQWLSYVSYSGVRRYVDLGQVSSSTATVPSQRPTITTPVVSQSPSAPQVETLASRGSYTFTKEVAVKNEAKESATTQFTFEKGDKVNYDKTLQSDGHQWLSYVSYSGVRRYVDLGQVSSSTATVPSQSPRLTTPVSSQSTSAPQADTLASRGSYTFTKTVPVKNKAEDQAPTQFEFTAGEKINYDQVVEADGYRWLSYSSYSGTRRYVRTEALPSTHTQQHIGSTAPDQRSLAAQGVYQVTKRVSVTAQPSTQAAEITYYTSGSTISYDKLVEAEGHKWISYRSYSGHRRYVKIDN
ncbi:TPA: SH3 domain-containing protein [Streptococcus suis]